MLSVFPQSIRSRGWRSAAAVAGATLLLPMVGLAQISYMSTWPKQSSTYKGNRFTYGLRPEAIQGGASHFRGTIHDWVGQGNSGVPPQWRSQWAPIFQRVQARDERGLGGYYFADNAITVVEVSLHLGGVKALGLSDEAHIHSHGAIISGDPVYSRLEAKRRLEGAFESAARDLAGNLEAAGITGAVWDAILANSKNDPLGGVRVSLGWAYDRDLSDADARGYLLDLLNVTVNRAKVIDQFRQLYSKGIDSYSRFNFEGADLRFKALAEAGHSLGFTMKAWRRMNDQNLYDAETNKLLEQAEKALDKKRLELSDREYTPQLRWAIVRPVADEYWLQPSVSTYLALNRSYLNYARGIYWENLAEKETDEAERRKLSNSASIAFKDWAEQSSGDWEPDSFMLRSVAIAHHRGVRGFRSNYEAAWANFKAADAAGSVDAKNWVGTYLDTHLGMKNDPVAAVKKFHEAAGLGSTRANWNLGVSHVFGAGVPQDFGLAREYFQKSGMNFEFFQKNVLGPTSNVWSATSPDGDELWVIPEGEQRFPIRLKINPDRKKNSGRVLAYTVRYKLASVGAANIEIAAGSRNWTSPFFRDHSPPALVQEAGEATVWVSSPVPRYYSDFLLVNLRDPVTDKVVLEVKVPAVARWDR